jgi:predicted nucleic-acid-binding protein
VKIAPDTNVLVRAVAADDPQQTASARRLLGQAELVALGLTALCELVWVLGRGYGLSKSDIAEALRRMMNDANVATDRAAIEAGLAMLDAGGDFADAIVALQGERLGADTFVSFDRRAVGLVSSKGGKAQLL